MDGAHAKRRTLVACILGSAIVFVDQTVVNLALPALGAGLAGPTYALIEQPQHGFDAPQIWIPFVAGIGALVAFVRYERRAPDPMLPPSLFASRNFAIGNAVTFAVYAGLGAASFFIALFLQQIAGYGALEAGLAMAPVTLLLVTLSRPFGGLATRVGPRLLMAGGPIVGGLGLLAFARLDADVDYLTDVLPAATLFGLGLAMTVAPLTATVLQAVETGRSGIASGVNNAIARVAALVAIAAVGAVVAAQLAASLDRPRAPPADAAYIAEAREHPLMIAGGALAAAGIANPARGGDTTSHVLGRVSSRS